MRALLVPVKAFSAAKARLSPALSASERGDLARRLAKGVLAAAGDLVPFVVCDDDEVATWAEAEGATILFRPGLGLSAAVGAGVADIGGRGFGTVVVAHADLARPEGLANVVFDDCVALVPDLRHDGTNIAVVPTGSGFCFSYGAGSFERHRAEARRIGLSCVVVHDRHLASDIDLPEDLELLGATGALPLQLSTPS